MRAGGYVVASMQLPELSYNTYCNMKPLKRRAFFSKRFCRYDGVEGNYLPSYRSLVRQNESIAVA